jgi:hypothetical protein
MNMFGFDEIDQFDQFSEFSQLSEISDINENSTSNGMDYIYSLDSYIAKRSTYEVDKESYINAVVGFIESTGFDVYKEFDDFTIESIMTDQYYINLSEEFNQHICKKNVSKKIVSEEVVLESDESISDCDQDYDNDRKVENDEKVKVVKKETISCYLDHCSNKALRNNTCRLHLVLNKENICIMENCINLKSISSKKNKRYNDLCVKHTKSKRLKISNNS